MSIKDGGPAFPTFQHERVYHDNADRVGSLEHIPVGGMSLRDYFAGQALTALVTNGYEIPSVVSRAYALADAMLKAREAK